MHPHDLPVLISSLYDLEELAADMKTLALSDQTDQTEYAETETEEESLTLPPLEEAKTIRESGGVRVINWENKLFSICFTKNNNSDEKWQLSACKVDSPGKLALITDEESKFILSGFFGYCKEIESPSKMAAVRHFVGNDK